MATRSFWKRLSKLRQTKKRTTSRSATAVTTTTKATASNDIAVIETSIAGQETKRQNDQSLMFLWSPLSSQSSPWTVSQFTVTNHPKDAIDDDDNKHRNDGDRISISANSNSNSNIQLLHQEQQQNIPLWATEAWSQIEDATYAWLNKYVINTSNEKEWHFRTLFVAEVSILPFLLAFVFITTWLLNRNTHIHKTKGSTISRRGVVEYDDDGDNEVNDECGYDGGQDLESDDEERYGDGDQEEFSATEGSNEKERQTKRRRRLLQLRKSEDSTTRSDIQSKKRQSIQAKLQAYDVERDDDHTLVSIPDVLEEDSDLDEEEFELTSPSYGARSDQRFASSKLFLSQEKKDIWKIVKGKIPIFSYFNQQAMQICMENVEYIDLKKRGDSLWKVGTFDGSLYYVVKGKVRVNFHNFKPPESEHSPSSNQDDIFRWPKQHGAPSTSVDHEAGTVVTSLLALCEGMVQAHLRDIDEPLSRFVGKTLVDTSAYALEDETRLILVRPSCFSKILDRFPETILRVLQTVLSRTQRVTVQILVRTCGLRQELLKPPSRELSALLLPKMEKSAPWRWVKEFLDKRVFSASDLDGLSDSDRDHLTLNSCRVFAAILGVNDQSSVEVLKEQCSVIAIQNKQENGKPSILLESGTSQDACFLLLKGSLEFGMVAPATGASFTDVQNDPKKWVFKCVEEVQPGGLLGEDTSFTADVHLFEVRCADTPTTAFDAATVLLRIPREVFSRFITKHPSAMSLSLGKMLTVLGPLVHLLSWTSEVLHVDAAQEIVKRGEHCGSLFVVLNGRLRASNRSEAPHRVHKSPTSNVIPPEEYGRGKIIGEVGALAGKPWPFDVFAIRQSELARVPVRTLEVVAQNFPSAGMFLARSVASHVESLYFSRRRDLNKKPFRGLSADDLTDHVPQMAQTNFISTEKLTIPNTLPSYGLSLATIAVVPLTYDVDIKKFCVALSTAMRSIAPTKLLTKSLMREALGEKVYTSRNALHDLKMTRFLADLEENNRLVVYQADHKYTFWTRLCVRQADHILLVGDASYAPERNRVEQTLAWVYESMDVRIDLVVVGKSKIGIDFDEDDVFLDDDEMSVSDQLNNWSESRPWISGHHLVRKPFDRYSNDFHRMSRRVTGRSVGLVLGGGGARGIAHVGVIRALIEAGVTVDLVGGTSQGAFCGALFAQNPDSYTDVERSTRAMAAQMASIKTKIFDLTLPLSSIFTGQSFNRGIRKLLGKMRIQVWCLP